MLILGIAILYGWLTLGLMVGRQMAIWLKQPWSDPVSAGAGTLVLSLLSSMLNLIPCIGWLANALIWFVALGAVILTRFGTQVYPAPYLAPVPRPPAPVVATFEESGARAYDTPAAETGETRPDERDEDGA
jgi:hypothetical protein